MKIQGIAMFKPELRFTPSGKSVADMDLLVDDKRLRIVAWEDLAEELVDDAFYDRIIPMTTRLTCVGRYTVRTYSGRTYRHLTLRSLPVIETGGAT